MALLKGYLFLITDERQEFAKIGMARDVHAKFHELRAACPLKLRLTNYHPCTYARMREAKVHASLKDLHLHDEWFRWDEARIKAAITDALEIPDDDLKALLAGLPSERHAYPVKRVDTGEVFLNASEAALAVLGSKKLAPKIRLAIKVGCKCGPTTWVRVPEL